MHILNSVLDSVELPHYLPASPHNPLHTPQAAEGLAESIKQGASVLVHKAGDVAAGAARAVGVPPLQLLCPWVDRPLLLSPHGALHPEPARR